MRKILLTFLGATLVFSMGAAVASSQKSELRIGISQEFENLNPLIMSMSATTYIYSMVGRALVTLDANGKWIPMLAKSIPSIENGGAKLSADKKKLTVVWELREDAKWNDGTPLTCEDLAFTHEVALHPNVAIGEREIYRNIDKIEWDKKNPKRCTFVYNKPRWDFNQMGSFRPLPKHLESPIFLKTKNEVGGYEKNTLYVKNPTQKGLYNGPYQITEVVLGSHVTLEPNPHFTGKAPSIQKITIKLIPNTATLEANLRSNTIDMISPLGLSFDQAIMFSKKAQTEGLPYVTLFRPSLVYEHIDLNLDNPILKEKNVRKALIYAINREELVKALFEGKQTVAIHNIAPLDPWFTDDPKKITLYPYNKKLAERLLDEAGWSLGKDKYRYKNGQKLSLTFMTTAGNKTREMVQTMLQEQWKAVGIEVTIKNEPARVLFGDTTKKRQFTGMVMYAWVSVPENSPRSTLSCDAIPSEKNGWSGQNYPGYCNPEVDKIVEQLDREFDAQKRIQLAHKLLKYYTEDAFVIPLYYRADVAVIPKRLKGYDLTGHMYSETNFVENWRLE
ncbi:MAG: peptide ABC transporter substrate-binding protein [Bdellovibrionaceae bacterium]|nr:peptide ABC transporter substrate-binding protein [Pseudobdellovibrionaceae bacterium]MDW8190522.1 peptide ABC transporter substrate-binding protein [Pseudobdellovibrionaceae bacterium]